MTPFKIGIMGTGRMAGIMSETLRGMAALGEVELYAVASRTQERAAEFAAQWGYTRAYGSYEAMVQDPEVQLVYVATPHSHHYQHARLAVEAGRAVLCEKAFCANARQARALIELARERHVLLAEAMWIRYKPFVLALPSLLGRIGRPQLLACSLCYPKWFRPTIVRADLCGGALMDLGVYLLHFARICFGSDIDRVVSHCMKSPETGLDSQDAISLYYRDGRMANMQCSVMCANDRQGILSGTEGYIVIDNINNPSRADIYNKEHQLLETLTAPAEITGYEYEVRAAIDAIRQGLLETPLMPHQETLEIMEQMDAIRQEWGVSFPFDLSEGFEVLRL